MDRNKMEEEMAEMVDEYVGNGTLDPLSAFGLTREMGTMEDEELARWHQDLKDIGRI